MGKHGLSANNAQFVSVDLIGGKESSHIRININGHLSCWMADARYWMIHQVLKSILYTYLYQNYISLMMRKVIIST